MKTYTDTLWGDFSTVALPVGHLFDRDGNIELTGSDLSTFAYCCLQANRPHSNCTFAASNQDLKSETGYSHAQVERSLKKLQGRHLIQRIPGLRFEIAKYAISTKFTGIALADLYDEGDGRRTPSLRTVLRMAKLIYFSVPKITLERLAELKGPPLAALLSVIKHAGELRKPEFDINVQHWREMSSIACNETLFAATSMFEDTVDVTFRSGAHQATVRLLNPETGREIADEQFEKELAAAKRVRVESPYTRVELEAWFIGEFPDAIHNGNDLIIHCPRCRQIYPTKTRPTLRYDAGKGFWGVFYCDECRYGKRLTPVHLLAEIKGVDERQIERQIEKFIEQIKSKNEASRTQVSESAAAEKATS